MYGRKILSIEHHIDTVNRVTSSANAARCGALACCDAR